MNRRRRRRRMMKRHDKTITTDSHTSTAFHTLDFVFDSGEVPMSRLSLEEAAVPGLSVEEGMDSMLSDDPSSPLDYDEVNYEDLDVSFVVDGNLENRQEIVAWIQSNAQGAGSRGDEEGVCARGSLVIMTPKGDPRLRLTFYRMFPTSVSEIEFDATEEDSGDVVAEATFAYAYYEFDEV